MTGLSGRPSLMPTPALAPAVPPSVDLPLPSGSRQNKRNHTHNSNSLDIFHDTPIPTVVLTSTLHVAQVSESYCQVSDSSREQLLGCTLQELCEKVKLPTLVSASDGIRAALESARPHQPDSIHDQQHNNCIWRLRIVPIYQRHGELRCLLMELQDVTEAQRKQLELEEKMYANETFRILVETVKDYAIFMLDPQGNVASWNAGAQAFKGYMKHEIIGQHFSIFYSQRDRDDDKPGRELRDALRDGRVEDEGWRYRKDGTQFWANVVITPIYKDGVLLGFSKVTRDLSERKKAETNLIAAYEEASKLKNEFLCNMSHEIRTPMHGMLSALTLLLDTKLNPEQLELARVLEESGDVLLQVINDILDYSKLASGSFSISHDIISVPDIIQSVFRHNQKCCMPEVLLESNIDPQIPKAAEGDSLRYRQIVQNLMSNAVKFTEKGYVRIHAVLEEEDDEAYTIMTEVVDSGIGVPSTVTNTLFTPFMQCDNTATKRYKGTGLGLSICKSLAELMGGKIGFQPNPEGVGSIFWFTAKLKKVQQLSPISQIQSSLSALSTSPPNKSPLSEIKHAARNKRVLLAEDNPINRIVMAKMLTGLGFNKIDLAAHGEEAVSLSLQASPPYDLILMDINMPVLDGVQATRKIREGGLRTPIVALTANALKGHAETYIAKGMSAYVAKPVDRKVLVEALLGCLGEGG
ncbi:sensor histidine kinase-like protein/response regulator Fos-1 [Byssothecium circinans]|uniref:Sensor histidine kinase-like protein/response regulator Fos-1 n=1 Tax=Byssothecium circinans TaxID=147558 RepID=A0A6A5TX70_9PLEO|nr:sensor histidine kinase-like protein/response regulator Fos-1 [Byssothecium circinans]